jgi:hypothetical protein
VPLEGLDKLKRRLDRRPKLATQVGKALYAEYAIEMKESMRRTPVEYGTLRASHEELGPNYDDGISVSIHVGGPAAPYAVYVHENLEAYHKVGQAKFLESTILESRPYMAARVAKRLDLAEVYGA